MDVTVALRTRISTRAFLPTPVSKELLTEVLEDARWSPSGGNLQPWKVVAVIAEARQSVIDTVHAAMAQDPGSQEGEHPMYPAELWEPLRTRRYQVGEQMYAQLAIPHDDKTARFARIMENFNFFGAPVGLFFVTDDRMGAGQWAHLGMFMQSLALAAVEHGLATCMQEAWAMRRATLKEHFKLNEHDYVYCGMSLGYADRDHPVNQIRTERAPVDEFTTWHGWS